MDPDLKTQTLVLEAKTSSLSRALEFVRASAGAARLPESRQGELDLAVEEILTNLAQHAYREAAPGKVVITSSVPAPGELRVEFADQGREFDPLAAKAPDLTLGLRERPIGGLGIFLVKAIADSLTYRREAGWNRLSFTISAGS